MSKKSLLRLAEEYLRKHPATSDIVPFENMLRLGYTYSLPQTNSKNKRELMLPLGNVNVGQLLQPLVPSLNFVEKENRIEVVNSYHSISTEEVHEKVFQDAIFGAAKLSNDKNRWIYVAKKKAPKVKNHFTGGNGKAVYVPDLGELYDDVTEVGIFIWDLTLKKVVPIDVKIEADASQYVFAYPVLISDDASKFICHGYRRTEFGHGILHCFNRPVSVFEVTVTGLGEEGCKAEGRKLFDKEETCIFANVSPCHNYLLHFAGSGFTHTYYLDLVVSRREGDGWVESHRVKHAFVGYYDTVRSETFIHEGRPMAYFQTIERCEQRIKRIDLESGEVTAVTQNAPGQSYSISRVHRESGLVVGTYTSHRFNSFFYLKHGEQPTIVPPFSEEDFILEEFSEPIHGFYLEAKEVDEQFRKEKKPLLVLVHGGPHGHGDACITLMKYMLLKMGYAVLIPNYSGSVGFGQEYLEGATGNIGTTDAEEIIKLLEKVLSTKQGIDRSNVYVYGGSYGGYMSAIMGSRYDKYFKKAVILNGVLSIPANLWFTDIPEWNTAETLKHNSLDGLTAEDYGRMFEQSPISQPMKIPTLQFLGAKDRRVPYRQGLLFDAITKKVGTPIKTYVYENSAHSLGDSVDTTLDVVIKSLLFLEDIPETE